MDDEPGGLMCASHIKRVTLADGDVWIRHQDGGYCDSEQFAIETLTRGQAMALLLLARVLEVIAGG